MVLGDWRKPLTVKRKRDGSVGLAYGEAMAGSKSRTSASTDAATDGVARVEIVTRGEVRREYTAEERAQVLTEATMPGARVLVVAQRYGISPSLVYR